MFNDEKVVFLISRAQSFEGRDEFSNVLESLDSVLFNKYCARQNLTRCDPFSCSYKILGTCSYIKVLKVINIKVLKVINEQYGVNVITGDIKSAGK
jgi:hypothetical protein